MEIVDKVMSGKTFESFVAQVHKEYDEGIVNPDYFGTDIDNKEFWKYITSKWPQAYCGAASEFHQVNAMNLRYAKSLGLGMIEAYLPAEPPLDMNVLEIGPGLGACRDYIKPIFNHYLGIDYVSHHDDVIEIGGELPDLSGCHFICSSNVFQHLSNEKRIEYYKYAYDNLVDGGLFFFTNMIDNGGRKSNEIFTFGQITEAPKAMDVIEQVCSQGFQCMTTISRSDSNSGFWFKKIKQ